MAGSKLKHRVNGSTIIEVVVSMVIIVLVFGIAMMIFTNVIRYSVSAKKIRAEAVLQDVLLSAAITDNTDTQHMNIGEFRIEQEFKPYPANSTLTEVHLTAFDDNQQKVAEVFKIIYP
jgi:type II secretory pathway pseudopilin PulG